MQTPEELKMLFEQAIELINSGILDTLPETIEIEFDDGAGSKNLVYIKCNPRKCILGNIERLKLNLTPKQRAYTLENITEAVTTVNLYLEREKKQNDLR